MRRLFPNHILNCFLLLILLSSCHSEADPDFGDLSFTTPKCGKALLPFEVDTYENLSTQPSAIEHIELEGTCLIVEFAYSGCGISESNLMAFLDYSSFIPVMYAKVGQLHPGLCDAYITHTDTFDLRTAGYELYDGITLKIHNWDNSFIFDIEE